MTILCPAEIEGTSVSCLPPSTGVAQFPPSGLDAIACERCRVKHDDPGRPFSDHSFLAESKNARIVRYRTEELRAPD
jgi:hypothetical protein